MRSLRLAVALTVAACALAAGAAEPASIPRLDKLSATPPDAERRTVIEGAPQAVPASAHVIAVNTHSGHYAIVVARSDGSFEAPLTASPGDAILIKSDPGGAHARVFLERANPVIDHAMHELISLRGTILNVPSGVVPPAFVDSGTSGSFLPYWSISGTLDRLAYVPGETITIEATYVIDGPSTGTNPGVDVRATLIAVSRADGTGALDQNTYASTFFTPTGLPIERTSAPFTGLAVTVPRKTLQADGNRFKASISLSLPVPANLPAGLYRPIIELNPVGLAGGMPVGVHVTTFLGNAHRRAFSAAYLPVIRIGSPAPPRMHWTLLANTLTEGVRGVGAVEDRGRFAIAPRVATASDRLVVPRTDIRTGTALRYNIEPFAPAMGLADRGAPINPTLVPLRFPSGSLTATVHGPGGTTTTIGPAPFRQIVLFGPSTPSGQLLENGGHISDPVQLSTLDPAFNIEFPVDGRYTIVLDGSIDDVSGNRWTGRGTYEIDVARPLVLEPATIPGTPFETGDQLVRAVRLIPPVPADVQMRVRFAPGSRPDRMIDETVSLRANRYGVAAGLPFSFLEAGEYRVDITATWRDSSNELWIGTHTWGGVVASPDSPILARGMRGLDEQNTGRAQWFSRQKLGLPAGRGHVPFPFSSGDVTWLEDQDSSIPIVNFHDPSDIIGAVLRPKVSPRMPPNLYDRFATDGEIPLYSFGKQYDPSVDPASIDVSAYSYRSVQRPLVRVREEIGETGIPAPYWRFSDRYGNQSGNGPFGDLPNDFKFQFAAVVLRGPAFPSPHYAVYGSLFVLVPNDDPDGGTRTFPPFQGNGGGPTGGPLFRLKGKEIDLFFHPTATRPGSIVQRGERVSFAGYSAPPLSSKIEVLVTSPSGETRTLRDRANSIGYFHDPGLDFVPLETGVWKARVTITFDGRTSAGQVTAPLPTGDVLGSREGEFFFYLVDPRESALEMSSVPRFVRPSDGPIQFTALRPPGLTDVQLARTVVMPGFVLEEEISNSLTFRYDAPRLSETFPNLDRGHHEASGADTITISLLLSGTDSGGTRRHFARQFVIQGEEILMPAQPPAQQRRRSVH